MQKILDACSYFRPIIPTAQIVSKPPKHINSIIVSAIKREGIYNYVKSNHIYQNSHTDL